MIDMLGSDGHRGLIVAANWKMHMTIDAARDLIHNFVQCPDSSVKLVLFVPATMLAAVSGFVREKNIATGLQNIHWEDEGAFTGEVSAQHLLDAGGSYVIIGHSERRQMFGEEDATVNLKLRTAQRHGITPVVCVGETLAERESGDFEKVLCRQLIAGLIDTNPSPLVIAYEPVWAIGTGRVATPEQAHEAMRWIRRVLIERFGAAGEKIPLLYGGSAKPENVAELAADSIVDGFLIGGASLSAKSLNEILQRLSSGMCRESLKRQVAESVYLAMRPHLGAK
ncbi:MAG: triose-phosphate isomerase [Defluviitaleaceae bacterium]|nr:triose-phosphate isomerase [Defluviitaleaceae bacterium]